MYFTREIEMPVETASWQSIGNCVVGYRLHGRETGANGSSSRARMSIKNRRRPMAVCQVSISCAQ